MMKTEVIEDKTSDNFHGTIVADPYRWLENSSSSRTVEWEKDQSGRTEQHLASILGRKKIKEKLTAHWNFPKYAVPQKKGDYYYYSKNGGLQNQPILHRGKELTNPSTEIVINPNELNAEGTSALTNTTFNKDGSLMAYAISENGSDWQEIKIRNMETLTDYPETLKRCKFSTLAWTEDGDGFYYSRFPEQGTVSEEDESNFNRLYFHKLNTPQIEDVLIYERTDDKEIAFEPVLTDDYNYLIVTLWKGTENKSQLYFRSNKENGEFIPLINKDDGYYSFIGNEGSIFYIYTNQNAPNGKIIAVDIEQPEEENWIEVIPEQKEVLSFIRKIDDKLVVTSMLHARDQVKLYDLSGSFIKKLELPDMITIIDISTNKKQQELFISYSSYLSPNTIMRYDLEKGSLEVLFPSGAKLDSSKFETKQVFYPSKDGTKIPMFITHKRGVKLTGNHPVLLYGYGGFNISLTPSYSPSNAMFIEDGGIYAVANIRGGGEYGEAWHQAGTFGNKQRVFEDFIAAGEWLIDNEYTNSSKLAIMGGSNGGLLVSACMNQRPDLFGAVVCQVPVTDMLRYQRFTVGRFWTSEFGNAEESEEHFNNVYAYSPLHNVTPGIKYPATLVTTADTDDRVVPLHAKKYTATLQKAQAGKAPILLRIEKNAGHGLGKPTSKIIEEYTDIYTFIYDSLGIPID
ncbi:prolyl oligopeptidase family serine peptidase [Sporosarcina sp. G11-34]|uniref:prolyl oligopeptidase family serine peptidase n=1 Tax=Sporosarcina sp. G11-34 TaxID=2849605 RepID=UPI0022A9B117|nr:prolyl oligopeptidase family serine peptidase [Sporosarcina sp. G11-34]MCZ2260307.1 prolyl oligopeptidase family serine peptidase [Sporosarcina sp. G11-34]